MKVKFVYKFTEFLLQNLIDRCMEQSEKQEGRRGTDNDTYMSNYKTKKDIEKN
jgi:hypothetical protein